MHRREVKYSLTIPPVFIGPIRRSVRQLFIADELKTNEHNKDGEKRISVDIQGYRKN